MRIDDEIQLIIHQRDQLIGFISDSVKAFHRCVFAFLTFFTATSTAIFSLNIISGNYLIDYIFILVQILILFCFFVMGVLFSANNNQDYIRAIDKFISDKYNVNVLFLYGELGFKHINNFKSKFSVMVFVAGVFLVIGFAVIILLNLTHIIAFINGNPRYVIYAIIVCIELISIFGFVINNMVYKLTGKSRFYDDCLASLQNGSIKTMQNSIRH